MKYYVEYCTVYGKFCVWEDLTGSIRQCIAKRDTAKEAEDLAAEMNEEVE